MAVLMKQEDEINALVAGESKLIKYTETKLVIAKLFCRNV